MSRYSHRRLGINPALLLCIVAVMLILAIPLASFAAETRAETAAPRALELEDFSLQAGSGIVSFLWRTSDDILRSEFRLVCRHENREWELAVNHAAPRLYRAVDESVDILLGGEFSYTLLRSEDGVTWLTLRTESVNLPQVQTRDILRGAFPNPFNPTTNVRFVMASAGVCRLEIFDARGRSVRVLADRVFDRGEHTLVWRGADDAGRELPSGVYFLRMGTGRDARMKRLILLR